MHLSFMAIDFLAIDIATELKIPNSALRYGVYAAGGLLGLGSIFLLIRALIHWFWRLIPDQGQIIYQQVIKPDRGWLGLTLIAIAADLVWLNLPIDYWLYLAEISFGLLVSGLLIFLGTRLFYRFFDEYLLDKAVQEGRKINSELLLAIRLIANGLFITIVVIIFAQIHNVNIIGLLASLGVGGLAIAFAAQKTLEQILGGIVLFLDRPFVMDDYISLPDGTFGRVESIGLRSTRIRASGKGTVMVVPNSNLASANIENFTSAKKVISLFYLRFKRQLAEDEQAFVRQIVLASTQDILGIDPRNTEIKFHTNETDEADSQALKTQAHIYFFILGSGSSSMDLRQQVLDIATQNVNRQLTDYGIEFSMGESKVNVESPITI
ncbi:MAG: mechanosensitive ion channel domain-containing protein [Spirulinaceae cyanobacterium]